MQTPKYSIVKLDGELRTVWYVVKSTGPLDTDWEVLASFHSPANAQARVAKLTAQAGDRNYWNKETHDAAID